MKKLIASALVITLSLSAAPVNVIAAGRAIAQTDGVISGVASVDGKPLANVTVRLRNVDTGQLVGETTANAQGQFSFTGLGPGNFVVEIVADNGMVLGTSTTMGLTAATMAATGVTVSTSGAALAAAGGVGAGVGGGLSATAITIGAVAAGLGAAGIIVATNDASPSS